jgi:hypothetical protein
MAKIAWLRRNARHIASRRRIVGALVALALAVPPAVPAAAQAKDRAGAPAVHQTRSVKGVKTLTPRKLTVKDQTKRAFHPAKAHWPAAATATATLAAPQAGAKQGAKSSAAGTPVWARTLAPTKGAYKGPNGVSVRVLPHQDAAKLGVAGMVFVATPAAGGRGKVQLGLDYAAFAQAYGGNYADRLHLVQLPACALTTPHSIASAAADAVSPGPNTATCSSPRTSSSAHPWCSCGTTSTFTRTADCGSSSTPTTGSPATSCRPTHQTSTPSRASGPCCGAASQANTAFTDPDHLISTLRHGLRQIQYRSNLINGCLTETGLTLTTSRQQRQ